ncbi:nucleotidyl transferase AbiEii/AbiGii toxin family protein [Hephaestia sp. GCM10023244]|uniref:nucleotidyl transferase AbiEii/AbiGii toxin family protein n=1 Tax=unclassified Hephaestia TaxID=2631281 RepID=UPI002076F1C2|nr:nucleotidyl transferase AbiEii/AbiGii toxin family protein [Hephaestia sp. MAHUQ-44]MCM8731978.1 nucleotidyl transferase AbiEii/AbiGii toxin family protein [Hephaestia sp. MAHUQ-44]
MPDRFLALSRQDRADALAVVAGVSGRPVHLLEKDVWVVWALQALFASPFGTHLVFKGGTSLSKGYGAIRRFSEDVDLTYDIRAIAPDLVANTPDGLPANRSQEKRWSKDIRARLVSWTHDEVLPVLAEAIAVERLSVQARVEDDVVYLDYDPLAVGTGYVRPSVMLEFGGRATGEPWKALAVSADAAAHLPQLQFPSTVAQVMRAERTFWEKATAIHVYCAQGRFRGAARFARHWHDLTRLDAAGYAAAALADRALAEAVAIHKGPSSRRRTPMGGPSTMRRRSPENFTLCRQARHWRGWRMITAIWSKTGCCLMTLNPSMR